MKNGELLAAAEAEGFEVLVTTDTSLRYQQNLAARALAVVVLSTTSWPRIQIAADVVKSAIEAATPGTFCEVLIP
jgi:hypothetical protein